VTYERVKPTYKHDPVVRADVYYGYTLKYSVNESLVCSL
jgi:hypothetical protein